MICAHYSFCFAMCMKANLWTYKVIDLVYRIRRYAGKFGEVLRIWGDGLDSTRCFAGVEACQAYACHHQRKQLKVSPHATASVSLKIPTAVSADDDVRGRFYSNPSP